MNNVQNNIKCPLCGKSMILNDIDYRFTGNQDEYWCCFDCYTSAFVKVRYGKVCKITYTDENGDEIKR